VISINYKLKLKSTLKLNYKEIQETNYEFSWDIYGKSLLFFDRRFTRKWERKRTL